MCRILTIVISTFYVWVIIWYSSCRMGKNLFMWITNGSRECIKLSIWHKHFKYECNLWVKKCTRCGRVDHNLTSCSNLIVTPLTYIGLMSKTSWSCIYITEWWSWTFFSYIIIIVCKHWSCRKNFIVKLSHIHITSLHFNSSTVSLNKIFSFLTCP